jgi:hypothetical protein
MSSQDRVLAEATILGCCEPVTWAASIDNLKLQTQRTRSFCKQLQGVLSGAKPSLKTG